LLTPALFSAAAIPSSGAVFADTFVPADAVALLEEPVASELLVGLAAAEGALTLGGVVELPHAARPRARAAAAQVAASRAAVVMHVSCSGLASRRLRLPEQLVKPL
jgi:hypothetical protein